MKQLIRSRRGVSTVISTILMIMVAMIGMSILFGFVVYYTDNYKAGAGSSVLEHLTIEDVYVSGSTVQVTVYNPSTRLNLGADVPLTVTTIFIDGKALQNADNPTSINFNDGDKVNVKAGDHALFKATSAVSSGSHIIKVVTLRSSSFESSFTVP